MRLPSAAPVPDIGKAVREQLAIGHYIHPRALWWAFDWQGALEIAEKLQLPVPPQPDGGRHENGCVLLIDEIDKAETDVPNGLLEALGAGCFQVQGRAEPVAAKAIAPLVIVTTNEERALPDAFLRRCLVLHLRLPGNPSQLKQLLIARGRAHFGRRGEPILAAAAELLIADRITARDNHWLPLPGQAEYLDLVRAVLDGADSDAARVELLQRVGEFVLKKHPDAFRQLPDEAVASGADADSGEAAGADDKEASDRAAADEPSSGPERD